MLNRRCKKQQQQQKLLTIKSLWPIIKITRTTRTNEVFGPDFAQISNSYGIFSL